MTYRPKTSEIYKGRFTMNQKLFKPAVCALAAALCILPAAACSPEANGEGSDTEITAPLPEPDRTPPVLPPEDMEEPTPPEAPSAPENPPAEDPAPELPPEEEPEPPQPMKAKYIYVRSNGLNVRAGAGTSYTSLGQVESDILLKYTGKVGDWYETTYKNRTAYVSAKSVYTSVTLLDKGESDVENVIEEGLRLIGVPYVYGAVRLHDGKGNFLKGFTVKQFDCSSLMQYIFYQGAGVKLDVTTRTQVVQGKAVERSDLKRGDLMFFTNASRKDKVGVERIGHVAMYMGDNYILHTASDYAKVEQISATRWGYYITARRML